MSTQNWGQGAQAGKHRHRNGLPQIGCSPNVKETRGVKKVTTRTNLFAHLCSCNDCRSLKQIPGFLVNSLCLRVKFQLFVSQFPIFDRSARFFTPHAGWLQQPQAPRPIIWGECAHHVVPSAAHLAQGAAPQLTW